MRKWFSRRNSKRGGDEEEEGVKRESLDAKTPKEKGLGLIFNRSPSGFNSSSGFGKETEHETKETSFSLKAKEVTLMAMQLEREIQRMLNIVKAEGTSSGLWCISKTIPLLVLLMGRDEDKEYYAGLEKLLVLSSHPSEKSESVQEGSSSTSPPPTTSPGENTDGGGFPEAGGETSPPLPVDNDPSTKLGLCDHLISLSSHPEFTHRSIEANLPSNLLRCLRIMGVIEYETAKKNGKGIENVNNNDENDIILLPVALQSLSKLTRILTTRLSTLLVTLCNSENEMVQEAIKPHFQRLLSIAVNCCPENAIHVQIAASEIACALASVMSSSLICFIHSNKIVFGMVESLRGLLGDDIKTTQSREDHVPSSTKSSRGRVGGGMLRSLGTHRSHSCGEIHTPLAMRKKISYDGSYNGSDLKNRSNFSDKAFAEQPNSMYEMEGLPHFSQQEPSFSVQSNSHHLGDCLSGTVAEANGMWLTATKAAVALVQPCSYHSRQLFMDFEQAGGYNVLLSLLEGSKGDRLSQMLEQIVILSTSRGGGDQGMLVTNNAIFQLVAEVLISCTPILSCVCGDEGLVSVVKLVADDTSLIVSQLAVGEKRRRKAMSNEEMRELLNGDSIRLQIVQTILNTYTAHSKNYVTLECRYHLLRSCIACLPFFESMDLKIMVLKVLEVVCVMFRGVKPADTLKCSATTFATCVGEILSLISAWHDQYLPLDVTEATKETKEARDVENAAAAAAVLVKEHIDIDGTLTLSTALKVDAELLWNLLEKILQFDAKKYEGLFADAGLIDAVTLPLLSRSRTLCASLYATKQFLSSCGKEDDNRLHLQASVIKAADFSLQTLMLLCNALCSMILASPHLGRAARDQGLCEELHDIIENSELQATKAALKVLEQMVLCDCSGLKDELDFMLKLVQKAEYEGQYRRQTIVLTCIRGLLAEGNCEVKDAWREVSGFDVVIGLLLSFDRAFLIGSPHSVAVVPPISADGGGGGRSMSPSYLDDVFGVIEASVSTLITAMSAPSDVFDKRSGYLPNRHHMKNRIHYGLLASRLYNSGAPIHPRFAVRTANLVFQMITEQHLDYITVLKPKHDKEENEEGGKCGGGGGVSAAENVMAASDVGDGGDIGSITVQNADAVNVLLDLLPTMPKSLIIPVINTLLTLVHAGGVAELHELAVAGVIRSVARLIMIARLHVSSSTKVIDSAGKKEVSTSVAAAATTTTIPPLNFLPGHGTNGMLDSYSAAIWERSNSLGIFPQLSGFVDIVPRLLELLITLSSHYMTGPDLKVVIQAVLLPLLMSKRGKNLYLGGLWGGWNGVTSNRGRAPSSIHTENHFLGNEDVDLEAENKKWEQLNILTSIATGASGVAGDGCAGSVPYMQLGGPSTLVNLNSIGDITSSITLKSGKALLNEMSHMQLTEKLFFSCAREEVHMIHVAELRGSKYSIQGGVIGAGSIERPTQFPWPGQAGYGASFWIRFELPVSEDEPLKRAMSWMGSCTTIVDSIRMDSTCESAGGVAAATRHGDSSSEQESADTRSRTDGSGTTDAKKSSLNSIYDGQKCKYYENEDQIVWIVSFSSPNGKAYLCLYVDVGELTVCVQSSSATGKEFRSKPLTTFSKGVCDPWHHIGFSHVKRSTMGRKMQGTTDVLHVWVDGEEVARFNVDIPSFSSQGGGVLPPNATFGIPVPQLFYELSMGLTTIPSWHLGPTLVTCVPLPTSTVSAIFVVGPSFPGVFLGEHPRLSCSAITIATILRRLLYFGGSSGLGTGHDGVYKALCDRNLEDFEKLLTATDRNALRERWDRSFMKEILYDIIVPDSIAVWLSAKNSKPVSQTAAKSSSSQASRFPASSLITNWVNVLHSGGVAAVYGGYGAQAVALPQMLPIALESIGGPIALYPLLFMAQTDRSIATTLRLILAVTRGSQANDGMMHSNLGYVFIANMLREKRHCLGPSTVDACFMFATDCVAEEETDIDQPKDWNRKMSIMNREKAEYVAHGHSMGFGVQGNKLSNGRLVLITEAYAVKHFLLNHQVWGVRSSPLLMMVLHRLNNLLSPSNSHAFCCFNAHILHRVGLVRRILHFLMEMRNDVDSGTETTQNEVEIMTSSTGGAAVTATAVHGKCGGGGGPIARVYPAAGVAACGLDNRDEFTVLCVLLLQRFLVINVIPRDFDRVIGATISLEDNASFRQFRPPGTEPVAFEQEKIMQSIGVLPEQGSLGTIVLTQGAVVRVYLLRMLFEILSIGGGLVKEGELVCGPQPCSAVADLLGRKNTSVHCMYEGKQKSFMKVCARSLRTGWFLCLLESVTDEAGLTVILQLLCFMMQQVPEFAKSFDGNSGFEVLEIVIRRFHSSLPVLLPVVALLMHLPISGIPLRANADTMGPKALEELFDSTPGPRSSDLNAVNCMLRVLLPSLDISLSILRGDGFHGTTTEAAMTAFSSPQNEGRSRGGDTIRAKTVASFLLQLFHRSSIRLNGFRLLMFEPGILEAFSKCLRATWNNPGAIIEDTPCGKDVVQLINAILSDIAIHSSPPGGGAFNAVMQILTGGRREKRGGVMSGSSSIKDNTEAFNGFRCYVVEFLVDYCRSFDAEVWDQQISPSSAACEQQVVDEKQRWRRPLFAHSSLKDNRQVLDNLIGATTAAAALLASDGDCCLRLYSSVLELCLSVLNSSLWECLVSPDDGEHRNSAILIVLRFTAVTTLQRATIGAIDNGYSIYGSSNSNSSSKRCDDDHAIQQELGDQCSSPRAPADTDSLLTLLKTIRSNLDVLLPLDSSSDYVVQEGGYDAFLRSCTASVDDIPFEDQCSENHRRSRSALTTKGTTSHASSPRQRLPLTASPTRSRYNTTLYAPKVRESNRMISIRSFKSRSFVAPRRPQDKGLEGISTCASPPSHQEWSTASGFPLNFAFAVRLCGKMALGEKLIGCGLLTELLLLLGVASDGNSNVSLALGVKEEALDLVAHIMCMQKSRLESVLVGLNHSKAIELEELTNSAQLSSNFLSDIHSIESTSSDNETQQHLDGASCSGGPVTESEIEPPPSSSSTEFFSPFGTLKQWLLLESKELSKLFTRASNLIVHHIISELKNTMNEAMLRLDVSHPFNSEGGLLGGSCLAASAKRAEIISKTYHRVAVSHKRWLYAGLDDMVASTLQWHQWKGRFQGGFSLWEGGVFSLVMGEEDASSPLDFTSTSLRHRNLQHQHARDQDMFAIAPLYFKKWRLDLREFFSPTRLHCRLVANRRFFIDYDIQYDKTLGSFRTAAAEAHRNNQQQIGSDSIPTGEIETKDNGERVVETRGGIKGGGGIPDAIDLENFLQTVERCCKRAEGISNVFDDDEGNDELFEFEEEENEENSIDMEDGTVVVVDNVTIPIRDGKESGHVDNDPTVSSADKEEGLTLEFGKPPMLPCIDEKGFTQYGLEDVSEEIIPEGLVSSSGHEESAFPAAPKTGEEAETSKEADSGYSQMMFGPHPHQDISGSETEVFSGFLDPIDWPVEACFNAHRSYGHEVRPCVALICKQALYVVTGYSYDNASTDGAEGGGETLSAHQPLHVILAGLRRAEQGASGIPGLLHRGEGDHFKVALRRFSSASQDKGNNVHNRTGMAETAACEKYNNASSSSLRHNSSSSSLGHNSSSSPRNDDAASAAVHDGEMDGVQQLPFGDIDVYRCTWGKLHAVYKRRYELRDVGIEVFGSEGSSVLIILDSQNLQGEFLASLLLKPLKNSVFCAGKYRFRLPLGSTVAHARAAYKQSMKALRQEYTKNWLAGSMTNFDYLMALNVIAGRSFNDITQYPVFPWVLADYTSEELDLSNEKSFRDLSKPMGAIGEERAAQFVERYEQITMGTPGEKLHPPPFIYGTHYSCAGYVLHYLVRLEPFSHLSLALQGGTFDKADRLFRDIRNSWDSASRENLQDVRELIPEFFYLPEFLVNSNQFDYGITQLHAPVNHVELPPWAKGDPREFVRLNRQALESDYVSNNLHHWIDLIFGYKQRGEEAVKAVNVFVHLTYEGEVDVDSISDPLLRESTIAQINNFGQTPSRLFNQPHPKRDVPPVLTDGILDIGALTWHETLTPPMCIVGAPARIALAPVTKASALGYYGLREIPISDATYLPDSNRIVAVGKGGVLYQPEVSSDIYIRFDSPIAPGGVCFYSSAHAFGKGSICDRLISCQSGLHRGAITATVCTQGGILVTGGVDSAVCIWDLKALVPYTKWQMPSNTKSLHLRGVLSGHSSAISCLAACEPCGLVVSGGKDANVLMWDLWNCSFIRHLPGHSESIVGVSINNSNGNIVTFAGMVIRIWSMNGDLLARYFFNDINVSSPTCVCATSCPDWQDGVSVIVGHESGDVTMWGIQWSRSRTIGAIGKMLKRTSLGSSNSSHHVTPEEANSTDIMSSTIDMDVMGGLLASHLSPPRELTLRRVLHSAHSTPITCVRTIGERGLLVGDTKGIVSKWQSIRLSDIPIDEAIELNNA